MQKGRVVPAGTEQLFGILMDQNQTSWNPGEPIWDEQVVSSNPNRQEILEGMGYLNQMELVQFDYKKRISSIRYKHLLDWYGHKWYKEVGFPVSHSGHPLRKVLRWSKRQWRLIYHADTNIWINKICSDFKHTMRPKEETSEAPDAAKAFLGGTTEVSSDNHLKALMVRVSTETTFALIPAVRIRSLWLWINEAEHQRGRRPHKHPASKGTLWRMCCHHCANNKCKSRQSRELKMWQVIFPSEGRKRLIDSSCFREVYSVQAKR